MARQLRKKSNFGIYHIMFRGNNKQNIFLDDHDRMRMISLLETLPQQYDIVTGELLQSKNCDIYAYCLMSNHVHLLYRAMDEDVDHSMKRLLTSYALYYNRKYERIGHVFQDRFRSEPCNDISYFMTLLRYIHQNPVKAGIASSVEQYPWSSWNEFINFGKPIEFIESKSFTNVCNVSSVLKRYSIDKLTEMVNELLPDDIKCIDDKAFQTQQKTERITSLLKNKWNINSPSDFEHLDTITQKAIVRELHAKGISRRSIARHTGLSYYQVGKSITGSIIGDSSPLI